MNHDAMVEDQEMAGADAGPAEGEASDDGSEDLEGESSGSEDLDEAEEEEEGEGDADEAMEVDDVGKPANGVAHHADEIMAH